MNALHKDSIIDVKLGDHVEGEMTVLFSDIRSFTSISEGMSPEENFNFLNDYLKHSIPAIHDNHGFIDKYIGDAVMAIFPDDPEDAVKASIRMLKDLEAYNIERHDNKQVPINIGIGLHTGPIMLGTIGNEKRMDGTVISDAVNLTSRLEGLTKLFGASIVISEFTLAGIKNKAGFNYRFLFKTQVKGKKNSVNVYEVFDGDPSNSFKLKLQTKIDYEKALTHYLAKKFSKALPLLESVLKQNPNDKAARIYLERSAQFIVQPVPDEWNGLETMDCK
jgi:two-component system sensor histidine kinase ChiS